MWSNINNFLYRISSMSFQSYIGAQCKHKKITAAGSHCKWKRQVCNNYITYNANITLFTTNHIRSISIKLADWSVHASYTQQSLQIKAILPTNAQFTVSLVHTLDSPVLRWTIAVRNWQLVNQAQTCHEQIWHEYQCADIFYLSLNLQTCTHNHKNTITTTNKSLVFIAPD